jgi:hypothetical protein
MPVSEKEVSRRNGSVFVMQPAAIDTTSIDKYNRPMAAAPSITAKNPAD